MQINELASEYLQNIEEFINLSQGKLLAFDFDGVMTQFQYAENRMLPCLDSDIQEYTLQGGNIYENIHLTKTFQYIFSQLNKENIWIVTSTVPALKPIKSAIINKNFGIDEGRIIHTPGSAPKIGVLKELHEQFNKPIIFIEDNFKILLDAEEALNFVQGYHISRLIP